MYVDIYVISGLIIVAATIYFFVKVVMFGIKHIQEDTVEYQRKLNNLETKRS